VAQGLVIEARGDPPQIDVTVAALPGIDTLSSASYAFRDDEPMCVDLG
jgi:hypothetical protein